MTASAQHRRAPTCMWLRPHRMLMVAVAALAMLAGCGDEPEVIETRPAGTPYEIPVEVSYDPLDFDHIVTDGSGAYFCVLRRPDDLAALRASFNTEKG